MVINSTEFQQNVGYYLGLAEKGETIVIERKRPKGIKYKITAEKLDSNEEKESVQDLNEKLDKYIGKIRFTETDSLKYQKRYRN